MIDATNYDDCIAIGKHSRSWYEGDRCLACGAHAIEDEEMLAIVANGLADLLADDE